LKIIHKRVGFANPFLYIHGIEIKVMDRSGFLKALGLGVAGVATAKLDSLFTPDVEKQIEELKNILSKGLDLKISINGIPYDPNKSTENERQKRLKSFHNLSDELNKKFSYMALNSDLPKEYYLEVLDQVKELDSMGGEYGYEYYEITNNNIMLADVFFKLNKIEDSFMALERGLNKDISVCTKSSIMIEAGDWCISKGFNKQAYDYFQGAKFLNKNAPVKRKLKKLLEDLAS
jgi:hypothetical protein